MAPFIFSQNNICAIIALAMAITIVWKAKTEAKSSSNKAIIGYVIESPSDINILKGSISHKKILPQENLYRSFFEATNSKYL